MARCLGTSAPISEPSVRVNVGTRPKMGNQHSDGTGIQPQHIVDIPVDDSNGDLVLGGDSGICYTALRESRLPCPGGAA